MTSKNARTSELAEFVNRELNQNSQIFPSISLLKSFFETLYYCSMNTEEGEFIKVTAVLIDPRELHADARSADEWRYVIFKDRLPFEIKTLVKLSKAADPWSSSIAVIQENGELWVSGLIDQALHAQSYLHYEADYEPQQPGLFQCSIAGIGILSVIRGFQMIATLRQNVLVTKYQDVLNYGVISEKLGEFSQPVRNEAIGHLLNIKSRKSDIDYVSRSFDVNWRSILSRILNQINNYHHGGAILITDATENLKIKYELTYNRLATSYINYVKNIIFEDDLTYFIELGKAVADVNYDYYVRAIRQSVILRNELKGAIRFVASQSRVDGLVLLSPTLTLRGFGTVITGLERPDEVYVAKAANASPSSLTKRDPSSFGTRHQSMFAYCWHHPSSIGFVISQDGEIRAVMRVENKLVIWENIKTNKFTRPTSRSFLSSKASPPIEAYQFMG